MQVVYWSEDDGALYLPKHIDEAQPDGSNDVHGFRRKVLTTGVVHLTLEEVAQGESSIAEILTRVGYLKNV